VKDFFACKSHQQRLAHLMNGSHINKSEKKKKKGLTLLYPFGKEEGLIALKFGVTLIFQISTFHMHLDSITPTQN